MRVWELSAFHITRFVAWLKLQMGPFGRLKICRTADGSGEIFWLSRSNEYAAQVIEASRGA